MPVLFPVSSAPPEPRLLQLVGERHVVVVKRQQTSTPGYETCEFEERPGPEPPGMRDPTCRIYVAEEDRGLL